MAAKGHGMCGGCSAPKYPDDDTSDTNKQTIHEILNAVKQDLHEKTGRAIEDMKVVSYTSQVVSGTNYFVKVCVGVEEYVHIRIWKKLPCHGGNIELIDIQFGKTLKDPIEYF